MIIGAGQSLNASSNLFQKSILEMKYLTKYFKGKEETTLGLGFFLIFYLVLLFIGSITSFIYTIETKQKLFHSMGTICLANKNFNAIGNFINVASSILNFV